MDGEAFLVVQIEDADELLALQKLAYSREAERYLDQTIPPMVQTLEQMREDLSSHLYLKVVEDGRIIGAVRGCMVGGTCLVGRLIVHPGFQGKGLGQRLLAEIERRFPEAERYELFTGQASEVNLHIYEKCGYRPFREEVIHERLTLIYLEKIPGS